MSDRSYDSRVFGANELVKDASNVFRHPGANKQSVDSGEVKSQNSLSLVAAANMKKNLQQNINRIDLLTDAKIGDIKIIMKDMTDQILKLSKRITVAENDMLKKEYETIPTDVMALTKTEFQLRMDLAVMIGEARETKDWLQKEFKRLRREHYGNLKDIEQILLSFDQLSSKVSNVTDRQGLND